MAIDYRALRSLTARELIAALKRDGFSSFDNGDRTSSFAIPTAVR